MDGKHEVSVLTWLGKMQRLASELRYAEHPHAGLAQQVLEDAASLMRRHAERPCEHWKATMMLPGGEA